MSYPFYFSKWPPSHSPMGLSLGLKAQQRLMMQPSSKAAHSRKTKAFRALTLGWGTQKALVSKLPQMPKSKGTLSGNNRGQKFKGQLINHLPLLTLLALAVADRSWCLLGMY